MFLTPSEISSHLYGEVSAEISRGDSSLLQTAIDAALAEAASYLSAYDVAATYAATGAARHAYLLLCVKDMAVWHYLQLANPAVDMELRLSRYEKAIEWLAKVQKGQAIPNLPYPQPATDSNQDGNPDGYIKWGGNTKRNNNF